MSATLHDLATCILADRYAAPVALLAAARLIYHDEPGPLLALISSASNPNEYDARAALTRSEAPGRGATPE